MARQHFLFFTKTVRKHAYVSVQGSMKEDASLELRLKEVRTVLSTVHDYYCSRWKKEIKKVNDDTLLRYKQRRSICKKTIERRQQHRRVSIITTKKMWFERQRTEHFRVENKRRRNCHFMSSSSLLDDEKEMSLTSKWLWRVSLSSCVFCSGNREANDASFLCLLQNTALAYYYSMCRLVSRVFLMLSFFLLLFCCWCCWLNDTYTHRQTDWNDDRTEAGQKNQGHGSKREDETVKSWEDETRKEVDGAAGNGKTSGSSSSQDSSLL